MLLRRGMGASSDGRLGMGASTARLGMGASKRGAVSALGAGGGKRLRGIAAMIAVPSGGDDEGGLFFVVYAPSLLDIRRCLLTARW